MISKNSWELNSWKQLNPTDKEWPWALFFRTIFHSKGSEDWLGGVARPPLFDVEIRENEANSHSSGNHATKQIMNNIFISVSQSI